MTSPAAPLRQSVILAPSPNGGAAATDAEAYRDLLRRLGFEVTTIVADNRAELDADLRRFATGVQSGGEVVVLALGATAAKGKALYLMPSASQESVPPQQLATSGVRLADALDRILSHGPKDVVAIVDACRGAESVAECRQTPAGLPDAVSAIIAYRARNTGDAPTARLGSLRGDLVQLMRQPGLTFFALYGSLVDRLRGTDMSLAATASLTRGFVFLPTDFLAGLPTACNQVQATRDENALRSRVLDSLVAACTEAAATWDFSPYFGDKLATVREQVAFQRAVASCQDPAPTYGFLADHASSSLRGAVERFKASCDDARRQDEAKHQEAQRQLDAQREDALRAQEAQRRQEAPSSPPPPASSGPTLMPRGDQPASFPCGGRLSEPVAQLICADADLAAADFRLGLAYRRALDTAFDRRMIMRGERDWVRRRNIVCAVPTSGVFDSGELVRFKPCLLEQTNQRVRELGS